jgi:hypothetical protein
VRRRQDSVVPHGPTRSHRSRRRSRDPRIRRAIRCMQVIRGMGALGGCRARRTTQIGVPGGLARTTRPRTTRRS